MKFKRLFALETIYLQNTIPPACSIHQRPRINTIVPRDQFQRIQISAELKQWLSTTIRHYSRLLATIGHYWPLFASIRHYSPLFATIRHYSPLFALFVLFAIRYSRLFAIRYSLFGFSRHPRNTFCPDKRLCFLAGKSRPTLLRGWLRDTGYLICYDLPLICHYLPLFATIRDCVPLFALFETIRTIRYSLFGTIRCSLFATIRYSLFGFSRHPNCLGYGRRTQTFLLFYNLDSINSIRDKYISPEGPHSWHWKVFATLFVRHLESFGLLWNTTLQPKHAFSLVETWVSWHRRCPTISGYSGLVFYHIFKH